MMRSPAPVLRLFVSAVVVLAPLVIGGCSSSSSSSPAPASPPATTGTATAVSTSYKSLCVSCHGADGALTITTTKVLKGTALTSATYSAAIRSGRTGTSMTAYTAAQMSDADIANDFAFFTKK